jgi:hypothetical protein
MFVPSTGNREPGESISRFIALQSELVGIMSDASGFDLRARKVPSPAIKQVKLSVGAWFHAHAGHEKYHLLQIEALRADPSLPH